MQQSNDVPTYIRDRKALECVRTVMSLAGESTPLEGPAISEAMGFLQDDGALLYDVGGDCLMPVRDGAAFRVCSVQSDQYSHVISEPVLNRVASLVSGELRVAQFIPYRPGDFANLTRGDSGPPGRVPDWECGRQELFSVFIGKASTRGFSCGNCDGPVFRPLEHPSEFGGGPAFSLDAFQGRSCFVDPGAGVGSDLFLYQLSLLSYRAVLGGASWLRGCLRSVENAVAQREASMSGRRRREMLSRLDVVPQAMDPLLAFKSKLDPRFAVGSGPGMVHLVCEGFSGLPFASCGVESMDRRFWLDGVCPFYTRTFYPDESGSGRGHLVLSCLEESWPSLERKMEQDASRAGFSLSGRGEGSSALVELCSRDPFFFCNPDKFHDFDRDHHRVANLLRESLWVNRIRDYHERIVSVGACQCK